MVERVDCYSDDEYRQALQYEEDEYYYGLLQKAMLEAAIEEAAIEQGKSLDK